MSAPVANVDSRRRADTARAILARHFPAGGVPEGLLSDIYRALAAAELRGFGDCLAIFKREAA